uniref:Uncharacterized protein n=1 Tax=Haptolina ericina TaxID=156174 RepID=A0A7S3API9_9EUKA|mmetsp:Transcript_27914/g.63090  ORF Transcript_27914/g.63090 Transcript_27914/m.63090 type:complete len:144 (+) Transcript_27914:136-567(+)
MRHRAFGARAVIFPYSDRAVPRSRSKKATARLKATHCIRMGREGGCFVTPSRPCNRLQLLPMGWKLLPTATGDHLTRKRAKPSAGRSDRHELLNVTALKQQRKYIIGFSGVPEARKQVSLGQSKVACGQHKPGTRVDTANRPA